MKLFAALDAVGAVRFVGEVERGSACGCFCPVCASPLVARQGKLKEWHFAHEASQERVECEVGALNMLRRVTAEMLLSKPLPLLSDYNQFVTGRSPSQVVTGVASWAAQIVPDDLSWDVRGTLSQPFLSGMLTTGVPFDAFILVNEQRPTFPPATDQERAHLVYWLATPVHSDFLRRTDLEQHIGRAGRWIWRSHPEYQGLVAAARHKAQQQAEADEIARMDCRARMREEWNRQELRSRQERDRLDAEWQAQKAAKDANLPDNTVPWAPDRKPYSSFLFYQLRDGQGSWVIYQLFDGSYRMVPLPEFDGWDEAMPPSVGIPEVDAEAYRTPELIAAMSYLAARAEQVRTTSSASEIEQLAGVGGFDTAPSAGERSEL